MLLVLVFGLPQQFQLASKWKERGKQNKTNKKSWATNSFSTSPGNIAKLAGHIESVICQAIAFGEQQFNVNHLFNSFSRGYTHFIDNFELC